MSRISSINKDGITHIVVHGSLVFDLNKAFREAYQSLPTNARVVVDLSGADYLDSAGLGMLIRLRDYLSEAPQPVTLMGANAAIRQILDVANFGRLFDIV